jgi:hypothetical protein
LAVVVVVVSGAETVVDAIVDNETRDFLDRSSAKGGGRVDWVREKAVVDAPLLNLGAGFIPVTPLAAVRAVRVLPGIDSVRPIVMVEVVLLEDVRCIGCIIPR